MDPTNQKTDGSLLQFIERNHEAIIAQWEKFAGSIPSARRLERVVLRDHAVGILRTIASDLKVAQTPFEQSEKSQGRAPAVEHDTQAELHAIDRLAVGFTVNDTVSEFRALRASVLQLWGDASLGPSSTAGTEIIRFNEAIDQALAESIKRFALQRDEYTRRFDTLLSSSPDLCFICCDDGRLIYGNNALCDELATSQDELVGMNLETLWPGQAERIRSDLGKVVDTREPLSDRVRLTGPDRADVTYRYVLLPVLNSAGQVDSIAGTARNISELTLSEQKVHRNTYYDNLTDLPNRALLYDRLEHDLEHAERTAKTLALLLIDLDGFKEVNERSGHATGDLLLHESARRIRACVSLGDTVARIGGDEFVVILTEIADTLHIEIVSQSILEALAKPFEISGLNYFVSGSIGITLYPQDGKSPAELLRNADQAMYIAKDAGRNRFSFFTAEMRDSAWARLKLIDELRQALALNQFEVYYQPIVDLASGAILKAEALVRWNHPSGKLMTPDAFVSLAEQTGLIGGIDAWVLGEAVRHARHCSGLLGRPFQISVNKSPVEFTSVGMMGSWDSEIGELGLAPGEIAVEITEGLLLDDSEAVRERLAELRQTGVQFTIDDSGVGYSSLSYLKKFRVDFVKIDQSFVRDGLQGAENGAFAETIVVLAHRLGLKVIAEGVETVAQRDWLNGIQCDYAQGFLFSKAVPPMCFTKMLKDELIAPR